MCYHRLMLCIPSVPAYNWSRTSPAAACNHLTVEVESAGKGVLGRSCERCAAAYTDIWYKYTSLLVTLPHWAIAYPNSHTDGTSDECVTHSSLPSCVPQVTIPPYLTQGEASNTKHLKEKAGPAIFTDGQDIKIIVCALWLYTVSTHLLSQCHSATELTISTDTLHTSTAYMQYYHKSVILC